MKYFFSVSPPQNEIIFKMWFLLSYKERETLKLQLQNNKNTKTSVGQFQWRAVSINLFCQSNVKIEFERLIIFVLLFICENEKKKRKSIRFIKFGFYFVFYLFTFWNATRVFLKWHDKYFRTTAAFKDSIYRRSRKITFICHRNFSKSTVTEKHLGL